MINISICDDDETFINHLCNKINSYFALNKFTFHVSTFLRGEELLSSELATVNILFLDVNIKTTNGIDIAYKIKREYPNIAVIFISALMEYSSDGYKVNAVDYIFKDRLDFELYNAIETAIYRLGFNRPTMTFDFTCGTETVCLDDIIYIKSNKHAAWFYIKKNKVRHIYVTLDDLEQILKEYDFMRVQKSYIINKRHFVDAKNRKAILINKISVPISPINYSSIKSELYAYVAKNNSAR